MSDYQSRQEAEEALQDAVLDVESTQAALSLAIATRDEVIARLVTEHEYTKYRVAQLADMSQTMVARIVTAAR